jgi:hypothetical protein
MNGHWLYKGDANFEVPPGAYGFVYIITNTKYNKKYIGRKYLTKTSSKAIKKKDGTKSLRKKKVCSESNWRSYMGSCTELLEDISKLGKENFTFEILLWGYSKGSVNYAEEAIQFKANAVLREDFYNSSTGSGGYRGIKPEHRILLIEQLQFL